MTPDQIRAAISADPVLVAMAHESPPNTQGIADALSAGRTKVGSCIISARGLAGRFPAGPLAAEAVLLKLEAARDTMLQSESEPVKLAGSLLRRQLTFLMGEGLDFGDAALRSMLDTFQAQMILTQSEVAGLKSLANEPDPVSECEVRVAVFHHETGVLLV